MVERHRRIVRTEDYRTASLNKACVSVCVRTVVELSRVVAQRDDLHPLLSVQIVVQLLCRQLEPRHGPFAALLAASAAAALHAGRHHSNPHPSAALLFGLMEEPSCWVEPLRVLWRDHHH